MSREAMETSKNGKPRNKYQEWRVKGGEKLDYWAASLKSRNEQDKKHAGMFAESVPSNLGQRLKEMEALGASGKSASAAVANIPQDQMRFLEVEAAFVAIAARSARAVYGPYEDLDDEGKACWSRYVRITTSRVRSLCVHVKVHGRPVGQLTARDTFAEVATWGMTERAFARWLGDRIDGIKEFLGRP